MIVKFQGNDMTLEGTTLNVGDKFPEFKVVDTSLTPVSLADTKGVRVFIVVPSIDTGVCDAEVKKFNEAVNEFGEVEMYSVSMDLPFAHSRWCSASGVNSVKPLSDYQNRSFAKATGTFIKELSLTTRAVFVVDSNGFVSYVEYLEEITNHPNYDRAFEEIRKCK